MDDKSTTEKMIEWCKSPAGMAMLRNLLAPVISYVSLRLIKWGWPQLDVNQFTELAIYAVPFLVATIISQLSKTKAAIIKQAAQILAERQVDGKPAGTIVINTSVGNGLAKLANDPDPKLANVVPAGSAAAVSASTAT